jgi:DnaJ domain
MGIFWRDIAAGEANAPSCSVESWTELSAPAIQVGMLEALQSDCRASRAQIRSAYHALVWETHPDRVPQEMREEAEERMKSLNAAYRKLMDELDEQPASVEGTAVR